jgi:thioredoxin 1
MRFRRLLVALFLCVSLGALLAQSNLKASGTKLKRPPEMNKNLYPENADAKADVQAALAKAAKEKKRVIVEFGAVWCLDCHILDFAFHDEKIKPVLDANYVLVHIDIGKGEKNNDLAKKFEVNLDKGIPALAVLNSHGDVVYSQQHGEFESARTMTTEQVLDFLEKWKPL